MNRIESTVIIEGHCNIGKDTYIGHYTIIRPNVIIGNNSDVRAHCFIEDRTTIGNNVQIRQLSNICAGTIIEDNVFIGMGCIFINTRKIAYLRNYKYLEEPPIIKYGARIGSHTTIMSGVTIGKNALIGAGSVVTKNVPNGEVWIGNPAKFKKYVEKDEMI